MAADPEKLELRAVVSNWIWVLGIEPGLISRAARLLTTEPPLRPDLFAGGRGHTCYVAGTPLLGHLYSSRYYYFSRRRPKTIEEIGQLCRI